MNELDSVVKEFLVESYENLDQLDRALVALEKNPQDRERLSSIFRTIHTIKGTCGFFGFSTLESVTHVGESLLSRLRDGLLVLDPDRTSALLALVDAVRVMLASIEKTGNDGKGDYQALIERLTSLQEQKSDAAPADDKVVEVQDVREAMSNLQETKSVAVSDTNIRVDVSLLDKLMNLVGELVLARNQILQFNATQKDPAFLSTTQRLNLITTELQEGVMKTRMQPIGNVWNRFPRVVRDLALACGKEVRLEMEGKETELDKTIIEAIKDPLTHIVRNSIDHGIEKPEARKAAGKPAAGTLLLRAFHEGGQVNIEIIDDGAGVNTERVRAKAVERGLITREQAARMSDREASHLVFLPGFSTAETITNVSGRGVGMDVVKTNIEKIGGTVDLQSQLGRGTTLKIKIPLTLAIIPALIVTTGGNRFAIPQVSLLELVRLEGEQARKGIEHIHGAPVYRLRGNLLPLVYLNHELGFDSAAGSTEAKSALIDFKAAREKHLTWKSRIRDFLDGKQSLTLEEVTSHKDCALGKWIYNGGGLERYGHLAAAQRLVKTHETLHATIREAVQFRDAGNTAACEEAYQRIVPLSEQIVLLLTELEELATNLTINIVILQADDRQFGLVVEGINDTEEIVVKPLGKLFKNIPVFAGATIMGDGRVALILDVLGIAQRSGVVSEVRDRTLPDMTSKTAENKSNSQTLLLLGMGKDRRAAIPLSLVARLEEIPLADIEKAEGQEVVQYRGKILPLIRLSSVFGHDTGEERADPMQVVVYSEGDRSVGFVVDRILDIVETALEVQRKSGRDGIVASAVIQQRVTDLLDVHGIIRSADPSFFDSNAAV